MKRKLFRLALFGLGGALLGFGYYFYIGCNSGSCPLTSNPYISTAYGALIGVVFGAGGSSSKSEDNGQT